MKKIEAVVKPSDLERIVRALADGGVHAVVTPPATCLGESYEVHRVYRGLPYTISVAARIKLEIVVDDERLEQLISTLESAASSHELELVVLGVERARASRSEIAKPADATRPLSLMAATARLA